MNRLKGQAIVVGVVVAGAAALAQGSPLTGNVPTHLLKGAQPRGRYDAS
jgi:hypothetical protein